MLHILDLCRHRCDNTCATNAYDCGNVCRRWIWCDRRGPFLPICWRSRSMRICRTPACWVVCLVFSFCVPALAQSPAPNPPGVTTTTPDLTMAGTIAALTRPAGAPHVGEALGLATKLSIATIPYGASSG